MARKTKKGRKLVERMIHTEYSFRGELLKVNRASDPNRAVPNCIAHMQINKYGASIAEVWDTETSELHAVIRRSMNGNINIVYRRDPMNYILKGHLKAFKKHMKKQFEGVK